MRTVSKSGIRILFSLVTFGVLGQIPGLLDTPYAQSLPPYMQPSFYHIRLWLSLVIAPACAISACLTGLLKLRKSRIGESSIESLGKLRLIVFGGASGIVLACFFLAIYAATAFGSIDAEFPRDNLINHLNNIAARAYQYRVRPTSMQGGGGSYKGFTIPQQMVSDTSWSGGLYKYRADTLHPDSILVEGRYEGEIKGTVRALLGSDGRLTNWQYSGDLDY